MSQQKRQKSVQTIYFVLCEGDSEYMYLQEMNKLLQEQNSPLVFKGKILKSGHWQNVNEKLSKIRKENRKTQIYVWLDFDIYKRKGNQEKLKIKEPYLLWSYYNFEDFLILHLDRNSNDKWTETCIAHKHFKNPLTSEDYEPLFKKFLREYLFKEEKKGYKKGTLPFELTQEKIDTMFLNNTINKSQKTFYSDFGFFVQKLWKKYKIKGKE